MKYGSIPIARKTGGLADTLVDMPEDPDSSNGFLFEESSSQSLAKVIHRAATVYENTISFKRIRENGLNSDCSWDLAAKKYVDVYDWALNEELSN
jgi:starch synthase